MRVPPWPVVGVVMGHDAANDAMTITFPSLQMPGLSVRRTYNGAADTFRINKTPLPARGTHGLVVFPHGDLRSPVWLGAIQQNLQDAIPSDQNDPFMHYDSHYSGHWHLLDQYGNYATQFADSSTLVANASGAALPTTYRNIVDSNEVRQRVQYPFSDRQPKPPPPFAMAFAQAVSGSIGGAGISINASGSITINSAVTGQSVLITYNSAVIRIDGMGNIAITDSHSNAITLSSAGITITDSVNSNSITLAAGGVTITSHSAANVSAASSIGLFAGGSNTPNAVTTNAGNSSHVFATL